MTRYEQGGIGALADRSHRPRYSPLPMPAVVETRGGRVAPPAPDLGPHPDPAPADPRGHGALPSASAVYRALVRHGLVEPKATRKKLAHYQRWERGRPMELGQMDVVGGVLLANGTECKVLTGVDDHSRFCVCAGVMVRTTTRPVCDFFAQALARHGVPEEVLTTQWARVPRLGLQRCSGTKGLRHERIPARSPNHSAVCERFHETILQEWWRPAFHRRHFTSTRQLQAEVDAWLITYHPPPAQPRRLHAGPHATADPRQPPESRGSMTPVTRSVHLPPRPSVQKI